MCAPWSGSECTQTFSDSKSTKDDGNKRTSYHFTEWAISSSQWDLHGLTLRILCQQ